MVIKKLGIGEKIKLGSLNGVPITWLTAGRDYYDLPDGSITLVSEFILKLMAFDAMETENFERYRKDYGNNDYLLSNVRQWMNSEAADWFSDMHEFDAPPVAENVSSNPYLDAVGFLHGFTVAEKAALLETPLDTVLARLDGGGTQQITDRIFLLSPYEIGIDKSEAGPLPLFSKTADGSTKPTQKAAELSDFRDRDGLPSHEKPWYYWLRFPYHDTGIHARCVNPGGSGGYEYAYCGHIGFRPACNVGLALQISDDKDSDGAYTLL
jgi:hypothetical protein